MRRAALSSIVAGLLTVMLSVLPAAQSDAPFGTDR
jgi:hypothetical protein